MSSPLPFAAGIPFTPQPVANWLYQSMVLALEFFQGALGRRGRFHPNGDFLTDDTKQPASGGQIACFWGTELGSRRDRGLIAWDFDIDLAVFVTPGYDFARLWEKAKSVFEPLGYRLIEHSKGYKFRICPSEPLALNQWEETCEDARKESPKLSRPKRVAIASKKKVSWPPTAPHDCNCLDIEVYTVSRNAALRIFKGTVTHSVNPMDVFPIVEGIFGPLRVPLPRTPKILDLEYGSQWRRVYSVKKILKGGRSVMEDISDDLGVRRLIWPSVALSDAEEFEDGYAGAGLDASPKDVPWRYRKVTEYDNGQPHDI